VLKKNGMIRRASDSLQFRRRDKSLIPTSPSEALSVIRKWKDDKARIRFMVVSVLLSASFDCFVISVSEREIGVNVAEQSTGVCAIRLDGCEFCFGADDIPEPERVIGLRLDV